jgi:hypothetical protein
MAQPDFKYHTWGRTRGPKSLVNTNGIEVGVVLVGTLTTVHDGYATENQRYIHLLVGNGTADDSTAATRTVTAYGYNHAFSRWFPLLDVAGNAVALTAPDNDGTEALAGRKAQTFEIFGLDRVAFVGVTADTKCWAACSTF